MFAYLENIMNFLVALHSGQWERLPTDEQIIWVENLDGLLGMRGLADSFDRNDPDLLNSLELLANEIRALRR